LLSFVVTTQLNLDWSWSNGCWARVDLDGGVHVVLLDHELVEIQDARVVHGFVWLKLHNIGLKVCLSYFIGVILT
jgi:hypothetical protein